MKGIFFSLQLASCTLVIDSQSVKTSENTSISGYDAGKKIKGRKRHIMVDTCGNLLALCVHTADIQDRDGAVSVFRKLKHEAPKLRHVFADGGYAGPKLRDALINIGRWTVQIVKRSDTADGFEVLPRRWVVERTFARASGVAEDWSRIGKKQSKAQRHGSSSRTSDVPPGDL